MEPRKLSSEIPRSSRLPRDFMAILAETLKERWPLELEPFTLVIEGRVFPEELFLRVGLLESGTIRQFNFEASADFDGKKESAADLLHVMAEAIESMMATYFEDRTADFPLAWVDYEFSGKTIYLQNSRVNSELENIANELLMKNGISPTGEAEDVIPDEIIQAVREKLEQPSH